MNTKISALMLDLFRGRNDCVAVQQKAGHFEPERGTAINATRLEREHLAGALCLGFYVTLDGNLCSCSCADFDNHPNAPDPQWRSKAEAFAVLLESLGLAPLVELSQSGSGAHVWLFFSSPIDAWKVRAFWRAVSDKLGVPLREVFPKQDKLKSEDGIGNLVRYPLWNKSTFVDVTDEWSVIDAELALGGAARHDPTDLELIAFQSGLGELKKPPSIVESVIAGEFGEHVPIRVARLIESGSSLLARRWNNDAAGMVDKSRSAVAMSLCTELVRQYVPTPEVVATLRAWLKRYDPDGKYDRETWINGTVLKAYDFVVSKRETKSLSATTMRDACHSYVDQLEKGGQFWVPSGIAELDASIDGVAPGEVCVVAGRPNHGKSAIGFQWAGNAATLGIATLIISEEMSALQIGKRRLMSISNVPSEFFVPAAAHRLRRDIDDYHRGKADVFIVESAGSIERVESLIDQYAALYSVGFVMIDYMQLVRGKGKDRYEAVTDVSQRIKAATNRNGVATLALSQLNRAVESRDDHEPKTSDLRESGGIEQDADLIVFGQYPIRMGASEDETEYRLFCAKRRNGPIREGKIVTTFNPYKQLIGGMNLPPSILDL